MKIHVDRKEKWKNWWKKKLVVEGIASNFLLPPSICSSPAKLIDGGGATREHAEQDPPSQAAKPRYRMRRRRRRRSFMPRLYRSPLQSVSCPYLNLCPLWFFMVGFFFFFFLRVRVCVWSIHVCLKDIFFECVICMIRARLQFDSSEKMDFLGVSFRI